MNKLMQQVKSWYTQYTTKIDDIQEKQTIQDKKVSETISTTFRNPLKIYLYFLLWQLFSVYTIIGKIVLLPFEICYFIINTFFTGLHWLSKQVKPYKHNTFFPIMTLIICYVMVQQKYRLLDPSFMYHLFRGQSTIKLYGLIFAIEAIQKILTKIGQYLYKNISEQINSGVNYWLIKKQIAACYIYTLIHAELIFVEFIIYMVVINGTMQNFMIFCFVINLTKMKGTAFKKFDRESYLSQINFDAKDIIQKSFYIALFHISQWERSIPDIWIKLGVVFIIGAVIIEAIKHNNVLIQCGQFEQMSNIINGMYQKMYQNNHDQAFIKCINHDFTVLPFAIFVIKMLFVISFTSFRNSYNTIIKCYAYLFLILIISKMLIQVIKLKKYISNKQDSLKPLKQVKCSSATQLGLPENILASQLESKGFDSSKSILKSEDQTNASDNRSLSNYNQDGYNF